MGKFIFDRTFADVERWRVLRDKGWSNMSHGERSEWLAEILPTPSAAKGMYTHNDLNRVESGITEILDLFTKIGYQVPVLEIKADWTYKDTITKEEMIRYLSNVEAIRKIGVSFPDTPKTPSIDKNLDHFAANDIEKILHDKFSVANNTITSWLPAGEIISGEV